MINVVKCSGEIEEVEEASAAVLFFFFSSSSLMILFGYARSLFGLLSFFSLEHVGS